MHIALRSSPDEVYNVDGENVVPHVHKVLNQIRDFSLAVRSGTWKGATGKPLTSVVAIGIGGSYLGANFVYESLHTDAESATAAKGRQLRFLANVDPVGAARALEGLDPETTLAIVISKTFTTRETLLNARTVRSWFNAHPKLAGKKDTVSKHMVAVSTNLKDVAAFGIDAEKGTFAFWDWVGGRYSVTSAVGLLPLALHYSYAIVDKFLAGCRSIDHHFLTAPPRSNLPYLLGLLGVWNNNFLGFKSRALACYSEAMCKLAPHIQQVDMESNGKRVSLDGKPVEFSTGEVNFGEPGTNSQHSFFQLFHQGQTVPVDFIGFIQSQTPMKLAEYEVSNHDELMANFFAQPDALAQGKSAEELHAEGMAASLIPHRVMPGNRPSNVLLLNKLTAYEVGQLLALYEHRTVVQGFVWGINSFDQCKSFCAANTTAAEDHGRVWFAHPLLWLCCCRCVCRGSGARQEACRQGSLADGCIAIRGRQGSHQQGVQPLHHVAAQQILHGEAVKHKRKRSNSRREQTQLSRGARSPRNVKHRTRHPACRIVQFSPL